MSAGRFFPATTFSLPLLSRSPHLADTLGSAPQTMSPSEQTFSVADIRAGNTTTGSLGSLEGQPQKQPEGEFQLLLYPLFVAAADGSQCYWPRLRMGHELAAVGDKPSPAQALPRGPRKVILRLPPRPGAAVGSSGASSPPPPPRAGPDPSTSAVLPKATAKGKQSLTGPSKSKKRKALEIEDDATDAVDAAAKAADASPKKRQRKTTRGAKPKQKL